MHRFPQNHGRMKIIDEIALRGIFDRTAVQLGLFALVVGRCILVLVVSYGQFASLPVRDPNEKMNMSLHIASWLESAWLTNLVIELLVFVNECGFSPQGIAQHLKTIAGFSLLQCLPLLSPQYLVDMFEEMTAKYDPSIAVLQLLAWSSIMGGGALLSFLVKIKELDFVSNEFYYDWSIFEMFKLACFVNSIASLGTPSIARVDAMLLLKFDVPNNYGFGRTWLRDLGIHLYHWKGRLWALVWMVNLGPKEVMGLCIAERRRQTLSSIESNLQESAMIMESYDEARRRESSPLAHKLTEDLKMIQQGIFDLDQSQTSVPTPV